MRRVSVLPTGVMQAALPERIGGAVATSMIGHLSPADRQRLWRILAEKLDDDWAVVELPMPMAPAEIAHQRIAKTVIGRLTYECWCAASPTGPDTCAGP